MKNSTEANPWDCWSTGVRWLTLQDFFIITEVQSLFTDRYAVSAPFLSIILNQHNGAIWGFGITSLPFQIPFSSSSQPMYDSLGFRIQLAFNKNITFLCVQILMPHKVSQMSSQKHEIAQNVNQETWRLEKILVKCMGKLACLIKTNTGQLKNTGRCQDLLA